MDSTLRRQMVCDAGDEAADQVDIVKLAASGEFDFKIEIPEFVVGTIYYVAYMSSFWTRLLERLAEKEAADHYRASQN